MIKVNRQLISLNESVQHCIKCPRLREHCQRISQVKRKSYTHETYWAKPVSGFGSLPAQLIIIGLAPGAHGANRTGRMFTGDRSGEWLYQALFDAGFSNKPLSTSPRDSLLLHNAYITAITKCAPPQNKPLPNETKTCVDLFLKQEMDLFTQQQSPRLAYLALGQLAWKELTRYFNQGALFKHGNTITLSQRDLLIASYHPSQQNTFTKKLTKPMFNSVFEIAKRWIATSSSL